MIDNTIIIKLKAHLNLIRVPDLTNLHTYIPKTFNQAKEKSNKKLLQRKGLYFILKQFHQNNLTTRKTTTTVYGFSKKHKKPTQKPTKNPKYFLVVSVVSVYVQKL